LVRKKRDNKDIIKRRNEQSSTNYQLDFLNAAQERAFQAYKQNDILIILGPAGSGKTHLATAFAIHDILQKIKKRVIITRPTIECGNSLGYLKGYVEDKLGPFLEPIHDCLSRITGGRPSDLEKIQSVIEMIPLQLSRGRTWHDACYVLDEAQNCTYDQLKLAVTRIAQSTKMIITADPNQTDLGFKSPIVDFVSKISDIPGIAVVKFTNKEIVRHSLISQILERI